MKVNPDVFIHENDRKAMQALKAIPGFTSFLEGFMKTWDERVDRIINLSSNLRVGEDQLKKYYDMLPPICEKLGIDVPELYIRQDVDPNAYTWGDEKPYIVMTSGLLDTLPEELIPTVLAHECGHIACHHALYTTMGNLIMGGAGALKGLASLVTVPLQSAFYYWMRCSELSADRAAVVYDGSWEKMAQVCMYFAGYNQWPVSGESLQAFMNQAAAYQEAVKASRWDMTLEFVVQNGQDHPFVAVRAYECKAWAESEQYARTLRYLAGDQPAPGGAETGIREIPIAGSPRFYTGKNYNEVRDELIEEGFSHIRTVRMREKGRPSRDGQVVNIQINGRDDFEKDAWFPEDATIVLTYNEQETPAELAAAHEGELQVPDSAGHYSGRNYLEVISELKEAGFTDIAARPRAAQKGRKPKPQAVRAVSIDGNSRFEKGSWVPAGSRVRIWYQPAQKDLQGAPLKIRAMTGGTKNEGGTD